MLGLIFSEIPSGKKVEVNTNPCNTELVIKMKYAFPWGVVFKIFTIQTESKWEIILQPSK